MPYKPWLILRTHRARAGHRCWSRDPALLEYLESCPRRRFDGLVNRVVWADRSPIQGSTGARGRWNSPDGQFEVLNASLVPEGADAEFEAFWLLFEQRPDRPALNWKLRVRLKRVVELGFGKLEQLGVAQARYRIRDYSRTQEISDGLNYLGCAHATPKGVCILLPGLSNVRAKQANS